MSGFYSTKPFSYEKCIVNPVVNSSHSHVGARCKSLHTTSCAYRRRVYIDCLAVLQEKVKQHVIFTYTPDFQNSSVTPGPSPCVWVNSKDFFSVQFTYMAFRPEKSGLLIIKKKLVSIESVFVCFVWFNLLIIY